MQDWLVTVISLVGSTLITTIIGIIVKHSIDKKFAEQKELEVLREEKHRRERKEDVLETIHREMEPINDKLDNLSKEFKKAADGTLSSLRNDILTCYYRCKDKGYRNDYDFNNIHDLFDAYKELGGNSFIKDVMNRFDHLPVKEDVKEKESETHTTTSKKSTSSKKKILVEEVDK